MKNRSELELIVMKGKVCIVTGSNSGIGRETALSLASLGAHVVMVVRNSDKGEDTRSELIQQTGNQNVDLMICDMSSMSSIKSFVEEFKKKYSRLDVLVNNAGAQFDKRQITSDGFERTLAVDYLAPFLLTYLLLDLLQSSAPSRIINVSSGLAKNGKIDFADMQSEKNYKGMKAYSNAKLMLMLFTYELARRLKGTGVTVNVLMPGFVATNLGRNSGSFKSRLLFAMVRPMQLSAKKGAETSVYLASSEEVKEITGRCFEKKMETATCPASYDENLQRLLWAKTKSLLGFNEPE